MSTSISSAIVTDYKVGIKDTVEHALRGIFGSTYPDERYRNKVSVHLEFPMEQEQYPAVYLTYTEGPIENVGVGHTEIVFDNDGTPSQVRHFKFRGTLNFNVIGRNPLERDTVSLGIINLLSFGKDSPAFKPFYDELFDSRWAKLQILTDSITPGGENVLQAPWATEDEQLYQNMYSVAVFGEFWNDPQSGGLVEIDSVGLFPYRDDQAVPTGSTDPAPWV